jgi:DNA-binding GntR family transcriptional regulator
MNDSLQKIQRIDLLSQRVYHQLRAYLSSGSVRWGETLREVELSTRLGVSRTPVREALTRLASEGFLEAKGRSFAVPQLTEMDIEEIYELRVLLETGAVRAATVAMRTAPDRLKKVEAAIRRAKKAMETRDDEDFILANREFRDAWLQLVPSRRLAHAVELYAGLVRSLQILSLGNRERQVIVLENMEKICAEMKAGDAEAAASTMLNYLNIARDAMLHSLPAIARHQAS